MEKDKKIRVFKTFVVVSMVILIAYFAFSIRYTAKDISNSTVTGPQDTGNKLIFVRATTEGEENHVNYAYTIVVGNNGAYVTIPHVAGISNIYYDNSVVSIAVSRLSNSTLLEILPKAYFTQTIIRVEFNDGTTAVINAVGDFKPEVVIQPSNATLVGIVGEQKVLNISIMNTGISPVVADVEVNSTPNIKVEPADTTLYIEPGERKTVNLKVDMIREGYGVIMVKCCNKSIVIAINVKPPFEILNYTRVVAENGTITIVANDFKPGNVTVSYNNEVIMETFFNPGQNTISFKNPDKLANILPITLSEGSYNTTILVLVNRTSNENEQSIVVTPVGGMAYSPGQYEIILRNPCSKPVNVTINVSKPENIEVKYDKNITLPPGSLKVVNFTINTTKVFTVPEKMTITIMYGGREETVNVVVVPKSVPDVKVVVTPITTDSGIVNVRIELIPTIPVENATVEYKVVIFHNGNFVPVAGSKVNIPTLTNTEIVLRNFTPTNITVVWVKIYADGVLIKDFSKTLVFKLVSS